MSSGPKIFSRMIKGLILTNDEKKRLMDGPIASNEGIINDTNNKRIIVAASFTASS